MLWGKLWEWLSELDWSLTSLFSINTTISETTSCEKWMLLWHHFLVRQWFRHFLKPNQFHSNNATHFHHLTSHTVRRVAPQHRDRNVTQISVTSLYLRYTSLSSELGQARSQTYNVASAEPPGWNSTVLSQVPMFFFARSILRLKV